MGTTLLRGLLDAGTDVDLYGETPAAELPEPLNRHPRPTVISQERHWKWDRWYSRTHVTAFASNAVMQSLAHTRLSRRLIAEHARRPYDCIFQLSQTELFLLGRHAERLPPIVVHPCTHAAGELAWHRRERDLARGSEHPIKHHAVRSVLRYRARVQRRELRRPALVVGPSRIFLSHLHRDYGVPQERCRVLRHPVDPHRFCPRDGDRRAGPVRLLYVSRLSVRKGLELIVDLSHRLDDLAGDVLITVVGGPSLWSDYTGLLGQLNGRTAVFLGERAFDDMPELYRDSDALLMPSRYEPGSLVVGEALASGVPIVTSDQVGPSEVLAEPICRTFPNGDVAAFESQVRDLLAELPGRAPQLAGEAVEEARARFAPERITTELLRILGDATTSR